MGDIFKIMNVIFRDHGSKEKNKLPVDGPAKAI